MIFLRSKKRNQHKPWTTIILNIFSRAEGIGLRSGTNLGGQYFMMTFYVNNGGYTATDRWVKGCWTCIENPTEDEYRFMLDELHIPESFINDIEDNDERPRREEDDGWHLIIIRAPYRVNTPGAEFATVPVGIVIHDDVCVTVCNYHIDVFSDFAVYSARKQIRVANPYELVMRMILSSSVWYLKFLKQININMKVVEAELQQSVRNKEILALQRIENSLVYFLTSIKGNEMLFYRMMHNRQITDMCDPELTEDVEIELRQAEETTNIYRNIIHSMSNSYSSVISNNTNSTMQQLTSISIIMMLPTLIASLYGMNVPNYMERNPYAFFYVLGLSVLLGLGMYITFKHRKFF